MFQFNEDVFRLIPLTTIFVNAFLVSRLLAVSNVANLSVLCLLKLCGPRISSVVFYLLAAAAGLSLFMPNVITVLTLLPALKILNEELQPVLKERTATVLALAAIWGANIGGMGSMVGSPANALFMGYLEFYEVAGRDQINFLNWLMWGVPLVALFLAVAWGILRFVMIPKNLRAGDNTSIRIKISGWTPTQLRVSFIFFGFIFFWILESIFDSFTPNQYRIWKAVLSLAYFSFFLFQTFILRQDADHKPLLTVRDCYNDFPMRGGALILAAVLFSTLLVKIGVDKNTADMFQTLIQSGSGPFLLVLCVTVMVKILTEILSNTAVSIAFFSVVYVITDTVQYSQLILMLAVALSSTCAFMSPIATPVNSLVFAELKNVSLKSMVQQGFLLNLITSLLLPTYLIFILPLFYQ